MAKRQRKVKSTGRAQQSGLTEDGKEIPDPIPFAPTIKGSRAHSIRENVLSIVRSEQFRQAMEQQGQETFEEADDFDVDDDFDPSSPYEEFFEGEYEQLRQARIEQASENRRQARRGRKAAPPEAEKLVKEKDERNPEPTPRSESGSARIAAKPGETPTTT